MLLLMPWLLALGGCGGAGGGDEDVGGALADVTHRSRPVAVVLRPGDREDLETTAINARTGNPDPWGEGLEAAALSSQAEAQGLSLGPPEACSPAVAGSCQRRTVSASPGMGATVLHRYVVPGGDVNRAKDLHTPITVFGAAPRSLPPVVQLAGGRGFSLALAADGTVWAWGTNEKGQLGQGDTLPRAIPSRVDTLSGIVDIAAGDDYGLAVTANGDAWAWGGNRNGTLGDGTEEVRLRPVRVANLSDVVDVAAGYDTAYALTGEGRVYGWGATGWKWGPFDVSESLYPRRVYDAYTPRPVPVPTWEEGRFLRQIVAISAGGDSRTGFGFDNRGDGAGFAALDSAGVVWIYGAHNKFLTDDLPERPNTLYASHGILPWDYDDGVGVGGDDNQRPVIEQIAVGNRFFLGLDRSGRVWSWGWENATGQLGRDTEHERIPDLVPGLNEVVHIAAGDRFALALRNDGQVWMWGDNTHGQGGGLGALGDGGSTLQPGPLADATRLRLDSVLHMAAGADHVLVIDGDEGCDVGAMTPGDATLGGRVYAWGRNALGERGDGTGANALGATPVLRLGDDSTCDALAGHRLIVYKQGLGSGSIRSSADGIDPSTGIDQRLHCAGILCWQSVPAGTTVTLSAAPDAGTSSAESQWQWDCTALPGLSSVAVQVDGPTHCKMRFGVATRPVDNAAAFTVTPNPAMVETPVAFEAIGATGDSADYQWDFEDDGTLDASGQSVDHRYPRAGTYRVRLRVSDGSGNASEASGTVTVLSATVRLQVNVAYSPPAGGTVRDASGGILCGTGGEDCNEELPRGASVVLTPIPDPGTSGIVWQGCDQDLGAEGCFIESLDGPRTVTALFN